MSKFKTDSKKTIWMRYLNGELSDSENYDLEQRLMSDSDTVSALETIAQTELSPEELEQDLKDIRQKWKNMSTPRASVSLRQSWLPRVAAVLFLGFAVWASMNYYQDQQNSNLYTSYFDDNNYLAVRGENIASPSFKKAMESYQAKEYENSFAQFQFLAEQTPNDTKNYLYAALSGMQLGKRFEAIQLLNAIKKAEVEPVKKAPAYWYAALIYLQQNNKTACQKELEWLIDNVPNGQWGSQATKLIKEL